MKYKTCTKCFKEKTLDLFERKKTGKFGLGSFRDSTVNLIKAIEYLEKHKGI